MLILEQTLWRAVIGRALIDLIEKGGKKADHAWFGSYDFTDVCAMAGLDEQLVLFVYRLICKHPNTNKKIISLLLQKYQLTKEPLSDLQVEQKPKLQK